MKEEIITRVTDSFLLKNKFWRILFIQSILFFASTYILQAQESDSLNVEDILEMSINDLMNVEVTTASKIQQQIKDVSATVQVITAEQIKERGYITLDEALSDLPGFQFRNTLGFNSYIFMRGAPSQNNLILLLVDGIQINELNSGGFYGGGQFNLADVERIEVVYGPASALYGTNAMSGIINIITKNTDKTNSGHLSILGGNFNTAAVDFRYQNYSAEKDFGFSVSGMDNTTEKADLKGAEGDNNWTNDMENFEHDISLSSNIDYKDFSAGVLFQEKRTSKTTDYISVGTKYLDKNTLWDITFLNSYLKYSNNLSDDWAFNSTLYYRNATVRPNTIAEIAKATDSTSGYQMGYYRPNHLIGIENQFNYNPSDIIIITGGIVGEIETLSENFSITTSNSQYVAPAEPAKPNQITNRLFSYFLQIQYKLFDELSFVGGLRHDFSNYYDQVVTPRIGLVLNVNNLALKLLYNEAFRAPKPWDYKYGLGNDNLKPEKMRSIEFAAIFKINNNLSFGSSFYKNFIKDKLTKEITTAGERWINKNKLNTFGIEVYGNYSVEAFSIYANYTYTNSYDQNDIFIPEISMNTANAGITYSYNSHFKINLGTNFIGERDNPVIIASTGTNIIDNALLFNGCISYFDLSGFDFQLKVNNILDEVYYHPSNRFAGRYRQPQRTIMFKVSYNF